jgi:hypothetical protein
VTREGTRLIAAFATAILAAALLSACGGSDSTTSASTTNATGPQSGGANSAGQSGSKQAQGGGSKAKQGGGSGKSGDGGSGFTPEPLRVSGGGSDQFLTKGGDNSIQEYGDEAGESELTQAAEALHGYLVARAGEDWAKACSYLTKREVRQLEQLGSRSPQLQGKGCPAVIEALSGEPLPNSTRRELTELDAASLRVEGEGAFLLYRGTGNAGFFVRMESEGGTWRVAALSPSSFP